MNLDDKILIVDDHPSNVELLEEMLEDDYDFRSAYSGKEAIEIALKYKPNIVLLDIMMPGIDGYEVCRQIRKNPKLMHAKVILVSAKAMLSERLAGYDAGADDYIIKPFSSDELLAKVKVYARLLRVNEMEKLNIDLHYLVCPQADNPLISFLAPLHQFIEEEHLNEELQHGNVETILDGISSLQHFVKRILFLCALKTECIQFDENPEVLSSLIHNTISTVKSLSLNKDALIEDALPSEAYSKMNRIQLEYALNAILKPVIDSPSIDTNIDVKIIKKSIFFNLILRSNSINSVVDLSSNQEQDGLANLQNSKQTIARYILEKNGGKLDLEYVTGFGSDVTLRLPMIKQTAPS